jgi:hypothetical protein
MQTTLDMNTIAPDLVRYATAALFILFGIMGVCLYFIKHRKLPVPDYIRDIMNDEKASEADRLRAKFIVDDRKRIYRLSAFSVFLVYGIFSIITMMERDTKWYMISGKLPLLMSGISGLFYMYNGKWSRHIEIAYCGIAVAFLFSGGIFAGAGHLLPAMLNLIFGCLILYLYSILVRINPSYKIIKFNIGIKPNERSHDDDIQTSINHTV